MRVDQFDDHVANLVRGLHATGVEFVLLEDDDPDAVTVVPGPSRRNLERLARALKRMQATSGTPGGGKLHVDEIVTGGARRWPIRVNGADADIQIVEIGDGRYGAYYEASRRVELAPDLHADVVPDAPILRARRGDATDVMPELELTQRERDRLRQRRRKALRTAERRAARRETFARLRRS